MAETNKFYIDVSRYNQLSDAQLLEMRSHGLIGSWIKGGQGASYEDKMCAAHVAQHKRLGIPYNLYHWGDPILPIAPQAAFAIALHKKYGGKSLALDMEQWWSDWKKWYDVTVLGKPGPIPRFSSSQLLAFYTGYMAAVKQAATSLPVRPKLMGYTAKWFIDGHCQRLAAEIDNRMDGNWLAQYVKWVQHDADPDVSWSEFHATLDKLPASGPALPAGMTSWDAWQFGIVPFKGYPKLDVNIFRDASLEKTFFAEAPSTPPPPPQPPTPPISTGGVVYTVQVPVLNIREGPGVSFADVGDLKQGQEITLRDVGGANVWIQFGEKRWAAHTSGGKKYLKKKTSGSGSGTA